MKERGGKSQIRKFLFIGRGDEFGLTTQTPWKHCWTASTSHKGLSCGRRNGRMGSPSPRLRAPTCFLEFCAEIRQHLHIRRCVPTNMFTFRFEEERVFGAFPGCPMLGGATVHDAGE